MSGGLTLEISDSASLGTGTSSIPITGSRLVLDGGVSLNRNLTLNNGAIILGGGHHRSAWHIVDSIERRRDAGSRLYRSKPTPPATSLVAAARRSFKLVPAAAGAR